TDFSDPLGPTDPCSTAFHRENPFSSFSPKGSHLSICTTTKICTGGGPRGVTPGTFNAPHRDPPTHCGVNLHEGSSAVAARYRPNAGASSIFRASCFGRAGVAYQKGPTGHFILSRPAFIMQGGLLTHLKFENGVEIVWPQGL
ncbi:hypothetical protein JTE90_010529, partial [Oedothorax gibbosus]